MKTVIGFLGSYLEGSAPSITPPWWGARDDAAEVAGGCAMVEVTMEETTVAMVRS